MTEDRIDKLESAGGIALIISLITAIVEMTRGTYNLQLGDITHQNPS